LQLCIIGLYNMRNLKLTIEGMHCSSCVSNIERILKKVPGVKEVSISLMLKRGNIETEDNVTEEEIRKAISKVGYKVTKIE